MADFIGSLPAEIKAFPAPAWKSRISSPKKGAKFEQSDDKNGATIQRSFLGFMSFFQLRFLSYFVLIYT